ncbi:MAG: peptide deformylase [Candidatus Atribacteria bacterium]|nr:peptide deformylase [Candidatus Atribacteria bacterium]
MALQTIKKFGNPVLREKAQPVESVNGGIIRTLHDMQETMHKNSGIGLAGNQVGVLLRLITLTNPDTEEDLALINPEILILDGDKELGEEGCLSTPEVFAKVDRPRKVMVKALNLSGKEIQMEAEGFFARILQHEIDHLDGVLFVDRLTPSRRLFIAGKLNRIAREGDDPH